MTSSERPDFELSAPASRGSVGEQLRAARISQGLTVDAVAKQLKLAARQVTALESDDFAALPDGPFVRGFVRNYARLVQINPDSLVHSDENRRNALAPLQGISEPKGELRDGGAHPAASRRWILIPILIGVVLAGSIWSEMRKRKLSEAASPIAAQVPVTPAAASQAPAPVAAQAATPVTVPGLPPVIVAPVPATPEAAVVQTPAPAFLTPPAVVAQATPDSKMVSLELKFSQASWTEIRDVSGNVLTSKLHPIGSSIVVSGQPPFRLTVGKASKVSLSRNGVAIDLASKADGGDLAKFSLD